jgi:glycine oxidase
LILNFDVVIVGGGVIGLAIARELRKRGAGRIAVIEQGKVGREASWAAAGMLAPDLECEETDDFHRFCTSSLSLYPRFAGELLDETGIDIELDRTGTLYLAFDEAETAAAAERYARQRVAGIAVETLSTDGVLKIEPLVSSGVKFGLLYSNDWQVENRKLVAALERFCRDSRVEIVDNCRVEGVAVGPGRVTGVRSSSGVISAGRVVLAAGAWTAMVDIEGLSLPVRPIRGQMIAYAGEPNRFRHVIYTERGYVVPRVDGRVLVGATVEDVGFDKSVTEKGVDPLARAADEVSPLITQGGAVEKWAGLRPMAADGLPVIGPVPGVDGLFVATGHFRNGILLAPLTGQIIAEYMVRGARSEYLDLFGPHRFAAKVSGRTNV